MPGKNNQRDGDFEEASSQLDEGLKSCHAVISGYRTLLTPDQDGGSKDPESAKVDDADKISTP